MIVIVILTRSSPLLIAVSSFKRGDVNVLLCCVEDVRGLDIGGVEKVGVVGTVEKEVYRQACGRMGRMGMDAGGEVRTFVEEGDEGGWKSTVEDWTGMECEVIGEEEVRWSEERSDELPTLVLGTKRGLLLSYKTRAPFNHGNRSRPTS